MILEKIYNQKQIEVNELKNQFYSTLNLESKLSYKELFKEIKKNLKNSKTKSFYQNLKKKSPAIIAECKKASPSSGILKNNYNSVEIAKIYEKLGASSISVLTDTKFFLGSIEDLKQVSQNVNIPVLRKDFLISPIQIYESILNGADAVLLIVRMLTQSQLGEMIEICLEENIDYLVEIHSEEDLELALQFPLKIIGINHRNLDTLQIDLNITKKLVPKIRKLNQNILIIAESGIENSLTIKEFSKFVDGFLIGTYFMKSQNIEEAWKELFYENQIINKL